MIGAPGAGKTTTLKRLIIRYLSNIDQQEKYGFPILVRLRDIPPDLTLAKYILGIFDITYHEKLVKTYRKRTYKTKAGVEVTEDEIVEKLVTHVGDSPITTFLTSFLNETQSILLLDGLDEIDKGLQDQTYKDIQTIGLKLNRGKILLTIRKSELRKVIDTFSSYEISPLSSAQIKAIASNWLKDSSGFLSKLAEKPYNDLANRPVFLTLLMVLYESLRILPTQPSEVYEDATYLIVKEWDEHRDIIRKSKYSDFNTRKKLKFIAELSYLLTYKIKQKTFSSKELELIFDKFMRSTSYRATK